MTSAADVDKVRDKLKLAIASGFDNAIDRYLVEFEEAVAARAREEGAREERAQAIKHLLSHAEWVEQHQGKEAADAVRLGCDRVARCGDALEEARKVQP
jgi:hypothetical protein